MSAAFHSSPAARTVDATALLHISARLQAATEPPWLHQEVARRMADRLPIILLQPQRVLDWAGHPGAAEARLRQAYPKAAVLALQPLAAAVGQPAQRATPEAPWWSLERWRSAAQPTLTEAQLEPGCADLLWANMALHHRADPESTFKAWHRALAVEGFVMFSTVGPGTLTALHALYKAAGWPPPFAPFVDMHDLGDMLVGAGFADPVMDQDLLTLTWPTATAALAELRQLGGNAHPLRTPGLRTPAWRRRLLHLLGETQRSDGRVALDFEVIYGHAFKPLPRARVATTTHVAVEDLRRMARSQKPSR